MRRCRARNIVEMGIGDARRAERMIRLAQGWSHDKPVRYTAIDLFETRRDELAPTLTLKNAFRKLKATGARVRVVPGDPLPALARVANSLTGTDLVLISADQDEASLEAAWFYVPRMLHSGSQVLFEEVEDSISRWRILSHAQVRKLAERQEQRLRAAA
jgi:hypothetical protein